MTGPRSSGTVELYLIRHGIAAERGNAYPDDTKRPLTRQGILRLKKEVRGLIALDVAFDQILTSSLARARQTADVFAEGLPSKPPVATVEDLAPGGSHRAVIEELAKYTGRSRIALVGHEPGMGELAAQLLATRAPIDFKKGAICRIDLETLPPTRPGTLKWFATPKMLRSLA